MCLTAEQMSKRPHSGHPARTIFLTTWWTKRSYSDLLLISSFRSCSVWVRREIPHVWAALRRYGRAAIRLRHRHLYRITQTNRHPASNVSLLRQVIPRKWSIHYISMLYHSLGLSKCLGRRRNKYGSHPHAPSLHRLWPRPSRIQPCGAATACS
jgi:hypothetical protein